MSRMSKTSSRSIWCNLANSSPEQNRREGETKQGKVQQQPSSKCLLSVWDVTIHNVSDQEYLEVGGL